MQSTLRKTSVEPEQGAFLDYGPNHQDPLVDPKYYIVLTTGSPIRGTPNFWKPPYRDCTKAKIYYCDYDLKLRPLTILDSKVRRRLIQGCLVRVINSLVHLARGLGCCKDRISGLWQQRRKFCMYVIHTRRHSGSLVADDLVTECQGSCIPHTLSARHHPLIA